MIATALALFGIVLLAGAPPADAAFTCAADGPTYQVRDGDGWFVIAQRASVGVDALLAANGATTDSALVPGDELCLPAGADLLGTCAAKATVGDGDGWGSIAGRAGVGVDALLAANGADLGRVIHPGEELCLPAGASASTTADATGNSSSSNGATATAGTYTVRSGDSWAGIAGRAGVTLRQILAVNGASATTALHPGDEIGLPKGAATPSAPAEAPAATGWVTLESLPTQGPCWFSDTWQAPRGGGRRHAGVDIFTLDSQYVYAVADGRLSRRYWDIPGRISGNALMLTADNGSQFFYAHLFDFAPGLETGGRVKAGQIIGWVGGTGNASSPHLHFEIRPGGGSPVNPYPILAAQGRCNYGRPYTQPGGWVPELVG